MTTSEALCLELAASANLVRLYQFQPTLEETVHNRSHRFAFRAEIDFDAHLLKPHEGPHPDPADY